MSRLSSTSRASGGWARGSARLWKKQSSASPTGQRQARPLAGTIASESSQAFHSVSSIVSGKITCSSWPLLTSTVAQDIGSSEETIANTTVEPPSLGGPALRCARSYYAGGDQRVLVTPRRGQYATIGQREQCGEIGRQSRCPNATSRSLISIQCCGGRMRRRACSVSLGAVVRT